MYNPEISLAVETMINQVSVSINNIRNMVDEDHPLKNVCKSFDGVLEVIRQMHDDYINCLEEEKLEMMSKDILTAINYLSDQLNDLAELYSDNK